MNSTPVVGMNDQLLAEHRLITLLTVLAEARPTLVAHFLNEEASEGFYDRVRSMAPTRIGRVDRLEGEHQAFLKDFDALAEAPRFSHPRGARPAKGPQAALSGVAFT